ncbi:hypothetical protein GWI33_010630 [Rhynchophorus ferrugineus]|uniref:Uncharacterized protein n=1 Tax=Rhynchophorus ferrugineus TaxID=354439 RepID=A0A834IX29_RHYFE|nr:hypothetical protein GWI33_010630 [Rhynchophorus ferrugineus]
MNSSLKSLDLAEIEIGLFLVCRSGRKWDFDQIYTSQLTTDEPEIWGKGQVKNPQRARGDVDDGFGGVGVTVRAGYNSELYDSSGLNAVASPGYKKIIFDGLIKRGHET